MSNLNSFHGMTPTTHCTELMFNVLQQVLLTSQSRIIPESLTFRMYLKTHCPQ